MGKRGPKPGKNRATGAELLARGSQYAAQRLLEEARAAGGVAVAEEKCEIILGDPEYVEIAAELEREPIAGYSPYETRADCEYRPERAARALEFAERYCMHVKGSKAGQLLKLEPWQRCFFAHLYGWYNANGNRRYTQGLLYVPRKNGKTYLAGVVALIGLFVDDEPGSAGAEITCAAGAKDQARVCYDNARMMVDANKALSANCVTKHAYIERDIDEFDCRIMKPVPAKAATQHGGNCLVAILDELHVQENDQLYEALDTSTGARESPIFLCVTTADFQRDSLCNTERAHAIQVRDGIIEDPGYFPVVYEASDDDDWHDPEVWKKANPNLGVSVFEEYFKRQVARCESNPARLNSFLRLHLNVRTRNIEAFIDMREWRRCGGPIDEKALEGEPCFVGVDLANVKDVAAMVLAFPRPNGEIHLLSRLWIPRKAATDQQKSKGVPYLQWGRAGEVTITEHPSTDQEEIEREFWALQKRYDMRGVAVDKWNALAFISRLQGRGVPIEDVSPSAKAMSWATKQFQGRITDGKIKHGDNSALTWMADKCIVRLDSYGNVRPDKAKSEEKIDGIVAAILAVGLATNETDETSMYDGGEQEVLFL